MKESRAATKWSQKVTKDIGLKYDGQPKPEILVDEAVFKLQPAALASRLKALYKDDFAGAMGAITLYENRAGKVLQTPDKQRLTNAKDQLRKTYKKGKYAPSTVKPKKPQDLTPVGLKPNNKPIGAHVIKIEAAARLKANSQQSIINSLKQKFGIDATLLKVTRDGAEYSIADFNDQHVRTIDQHFGAHQKGSLGKESVFVWDHMDIGLGIAIYVPKMGGPCRMDVYDKE